VVLDGTNLNNNFPLYIRQLISVLLLLTENGVRMVKIQQI